MNGFSSLYLYHIKILIFILHISRHIHKKRTAYKWIELTYRHSPIRTLINEQHWQSNFLTNFIFIPNLLFSKIKPDARLTDVIPPLRRPSLETIARCWRSAAQRGSSTIWASVKDSCPNVSVKNNHKGHS